jgi:hypothetical protein
MIPCDKSLTHNVALWSTSLIPKLNPFFIPFWCFMASNALTILCQVLILYTVIVVSIYNLTVESENSTLWTALLSSC